jgi:hypothetical protein
MLNFCLGSFAAIQTVTGPRHLLTLAEEVLSIVTSGIWQPPHQTPRRPRSALPVA